MSPRAYKLGLRLAAAEQTRTRIIEAARQMLSDDEFCGLSLDAIARRAGVARMTVYYQFASRRGLLEALYDDLGARSLADNMPAVFEAPDPYQELGRLLDALCHFWSTERLILRRLRGMMVIDEEIAAGLLNRETRRKDHIAALLRRIETEYGWKGTMSVASAASMIWSLSNFETYDALARAEGNPADTAALLKSTAGLIVGVEIGTPVVEKASQ